MNEAKPQAIYLSLALAALWMLLAFLREEATYHLAPPLVAAAVAFSYRASGSGRLSAAASAGAATSGLINALVATGVLALFDKLTGPTILGFPNATVESVVLALVGAVAAVGIGLFPGKARDEGERSP